MLRTEESSLWSSCVPKAYQPLLSICDVFIAQSFHLFFISGVRKALSESAGFAFMESDEQVAQCLYLPCLLCAFLCSTCLGLWTFWEQGLTLMMGGLFPEVILVGGSAC